MDKKCKCGSNVFVATESSFLFGSFTEDTLYLKDKGCGGEGIEKIECENCGKDIYKNGDFEIEFL